MSRPLGRAFSVRKIASVVILALGQGKDEMPSLSPFQPYFSALFSLWFWESAAWAGTPLCGALRRCGTKPAPPQGEEFHSKYKMGDKGVRKCCNSLDLCDELCQSHVLLSNAIEVSSLFFSFFFFNLTVNVTVFEGGHQVSSVSLCRDPLESAMLLESK